MSFYIEVDKKTQLVIAFNAVSHREGFIKGRTVVDENKVQVTFAEQTVGAAEKHLTAILPVGYEAFKKIMIDSQIDHKIPAFKSCQP